MRAELHGLSAQMQVQAKKSFQGLAGRYDGGKTLFKLAEQRVALQVCTTVTVVMG